MYATAWNPRAKPTEPKRWQEKQGGAVRFGPKICARLLACSGRESPFSLSPPSCVAQSFRKTYTAQLRLSLPYKSRAELSPNRSGPPSLSRVAASKVTFFLRDYVCFRGHGRGSFKALRRTMRRLFFCPKSTDNSAIVKQICSLNEKIPKRDECRGLALVVRRRVSTPENWIIYSLLLSLFAIPFSGLTSNLRDFSVTNKLS